MQDQREDRMSICGFLIDSADKDGTFLNRIINRRQMATILREDVDMR
jgi:hypothetical protein